MPEKYIPWLDPDTLEFPDTNEAWTNPNGILAAGGDLSPVRLIAAYCNGIFPWYNDEEPILWWSPDPRCVLIPSELKISKSLRKTLNKNKFKVTFNSCFTDVITACAMPRSEDLDADPGTWISEDMISAYKELHKLGYAHSVECWLNDELVGGLYGLAIGKVFFGESMFSRVSDASKVTFATLCETLTAKGFQLIDGQVESPHLLTLGFKLMDRTGFIDSLETLTHDKHKTIL